MNSFGLAARFPAVRGRKPSHQDTGIESNSGAKRAVTTLFGRSFAARHRKEQKGKDQMRRMRDEGYGGFKPGGEGDAQGAAPKRCCVTNPELMASKGGPAGEEDSCFIPVEVEDDPAMGPCETGMSTHDKQSPHTSSLQFSPGVFSASSMGMQGPSSQRPFRAYSSATCPCGPIHRTTSFPGNAVTPRHADMTATMHLVQNRVIDSFRPSFGSILC
jgi:hypothetical protein